MAGCLGMPQKEVARDTTVVAMPPSLVGGFGAFPIPVLPAGSVPVAVTLPPPGMATAVAQGQCSALPPGIPMPPGIHASGLPQGLHMGQLDFLAHLAASARMTEAMAAATEPQTSDVRKVVEEPAAFDKEALKRLALQAGDPPSPKHSEPPAEAPKLTADVPPPPPEPAGVKDREAATRKDQPLPVPVAQLDKVERVTVESAAASSIGKFSDQSKSDENAVVDECDQALRPHPSVSSTAPASVSARKPARFIFSDQVKRDTTSVTSILQRVQANAKRCRVTEPEESAVTRASGSAAAVSVEDELASRIEACTDHNIGERQLVEEAALVAISRSDPGRVVEIVSRLHSSVAMRNRSMLRAVARELKASTNRMAIVALIRVLGVLVQWWSDVKEDLTESGDDDLDVTTDLRTLCTSACAELAPRLMDIVPKDLAHIAVTASTIHSMDERFSLALARAAIARVERFVPEDLVAVADAFGRCSIYHRSFHCEIIRHLQPHLFRMQLRDAIRVVHVLALSCTRDPRFVGDVCDRAVQDLLQGDGVGPHELCWLLWSSCCLGFYHKDLFRHTFALLQMCFNSLDNETLCHAYESHLTLIAFRKDAYKNFALGAEVVKAWRSQYMKNRGGALRGKQTLVKGSEKIHREVVDLLRTIVEDSVSRQFVSESGLAVDVAVTRRRGASVVAAIELDGPHSMELDISASTPSTVYRVRGPVLLKRHLLQKQGLQVGVFSEELWRCLVDNRDRRSFLRDLLEKVGVPRDRLT